VGHRAVLVKVNAHVDEGIAVVVRLLNEFPSLRTLNSCEGNHRTSAFIDFRYGESHLDSTRFLVWLSRSLVGTGASVTAALGGGESLTLTLSVPHRALRELERDLRELLKPTFSF
jgi:hypothetical protein